MALLTIEYERSMSFDEDIYAVCSLERFPQLKFPNTQHTNLKQHSANQGGHSNHETADQRTEREVLHAIGRRALA